MSQNGSEGENSSGFETISAIEAFDSIIAKMNQVSRLDQINENIDENKISPNKNFYKLKDSSANSDESCCTLILYRISDSFMFFILFLTSILLFISLIALIFEIVISYYSVLMMNYVFFVSSIVSYTMAPIYQSLSGDWLNFAFSFTQVILASPLIAFYIYFILKSVIILASFISDIPSVIKDIFKIISILFKDLSISFISNFFESNYEQNFDCGSSFTLVIIFLISLGLMVAASSLGYVLFCLDKFIILLGSLLYLVNIFQIFVLISPSYLYFIKTLLNMKCKEIEFVNLYLTISNDLLDFFSEDSESKESESDILPKNKSPRNDLDSDDSSSLLEENFNKLEVKIKKRKKMIEDPYISDFADEDKVINHKFYSVADKFIQLLIAKNYFSLYYYSKTIAFDKHKQCRKVALMILCFSLNLCIISYDIYQLTQDFSVYFLSSIIIRFIFIPLFSYYNIFTIIFHRSKDTSLNIVLFISSILTVLISLAILCCFIFTDVYQSKYRISSLEYVPVIQNFTVPNEEMINHPICDYKIFNVSAIDAFGYSLGGYDIKRNKTVFDNQMKIFFNENYSSHISYAINEIDEHFLFIKYYDSLIDTHIFAFRGYNSGPEVAFQFELLAIHYIIPFFEDIVPFYELINEYWLNFYTNFLNSFGLKFFDNNNLMVKYVNSIIDIYNKAELENEGKVLFAGINCGGVIAKIVGTILHRKSISFISFPIGNDLFEMMFDFSSSFIGFVTNIYNVDGFFSDQEPAYATNIGIEMPVFDKKKFCSSGICEINSKTDNVYRTFCTISELCGKGDRFEYYCENIIGENDLQTIRESLMEND